MTALISKSPASVGAHVREPDALDRVESIGTLAVSSNDAPHRRRVLFITSRFPPVASVGAIRIRKFAKYLREFGWEPFVITGASQASTPEAQDAGRAVDDESVNDLPVDLNIARLNKNIDDWPTNLSQRLANNLGRWMRYFRFDANRLRPGIHWRMQRVQNRFAFPDRGIWRLPTVVRLARRMHRQHSFDAIFSSGMPFSDHLIALAVQRKLRVPWIADFRDPWVEYIHWEQWGGGIGKRLTKKAERSVVRRAARVTSVNRHMTERFRARYSTELPEKFVTIENGFDSTDFHQSANQSKSQNNRTPARDCLGPPSSIRPIANSRTSDEVNADRSLTVAALTERNLNSSESSELQTFKLLYAGSLYQTRTPTALIDAFCMFLDETPDAIGNAVLEFVGRPGPHIDAIVERCPDSIRYGGLLPHSETCRAMAAASINIVLLPNLPGSEKDTTAKIYECLGSERPILAAVPTNGAAAQVLRGFDGVSLCDPDDRDAICAAIRHWFERWQRGPIAVDRPAAQLEPFTRRAQAGQLADCLNELVPLAAVEMQTT